MKEKTYSLIEELIEKHLDKPWNWRKLQRKQIKT